MFKIEEMSDGWQASVGQLVSGLRAIDNHSMFSRKERSVNFLLVNRFSTGLVNLPCPHSIHVSYYSSQSAIVRSRPRRKTWTVGIGHQISCAQHTWHPTQNIDKRDRPPGLLFQLLERFPRGLATFPARHK